MGTQERIKTIKMDLQASGLDALLVVSPAACKYLSGCHLLTQTAIPDREAYVLLTAAGDLSYLVCKIEEASAKVESSIADIHTYVEFEQIPAQAAAELLSKKALGNARIAYEGASMRAHSLELLRESLPGVTWQRWDQELQEHWMIKSNAEVEALRLAGLATQDAISWGLTEAAPGSSEKEIAARIYTRIMQAGLTPLFDVFAAGPNMFKVHAAAGSRIPKPGELIRVDMGGRDTQSHVLSDMARTAVVGTPSERQQATLATLAEIQAEVGKACEIGRPVSELYQICAKGFRHFNLPFTMPHIGHGLGIDLHESPIIRPGNARPLQAGMVLNIEPFVAIAEFAETYHVEDLVLVGEEGPRWLTHPQTELLQVPC